MSLKSVINAEFLRMKKNSMFQIVQQIKVNSVPFVFSAKV